MTSLNKIKQAIVEVLVDSLIARDSYFSRKELTAWYMKKISNKKGREEIRRILKRYSKNSRTFTEKVSCDNALIWLDIIEKK